MLCKAQCENAGVSYTKHMRLGLATACFEAARLEEREKIDMTNQFKLQREPEPKKKKKSRVGRTPANRSEASKEKKKDTEKAQYTEKRKAFCIATTGH